MRNSPHVAATNCGKERKNMKKKPSMRVIAILFVFCAAFAVGYTAYNASVKKNAQKETAVQETAEEAGSQENAGEENADGENAEVTETADAAGTEQEAAEETTEEDIPHVIFDTDIGNCTDDLLAMQALFALQAKGECQVDAVVSSAKHKGSQEFLDRAVHYYKADSLPLGFVEGEKDLYELTPYYTLVDETNEDGTPLLEGTGVDIADRPTGCQVYRETLAKLPDKSAVIICIGMASNIGELLDSEPDDISPLSGRELVEQKVKTLYLMAGCFEKVERLDRPGEYLDAEYNVLGDIPLAKKVLETWPEDLVLIPLEAGMDFPCIRADVLEDYADQPSSLLYLTYSKWKVGEVSGDVGPHWWDPLAVAYALDPSAASYFAEPVRGSVTVAEDGKTTFTEKADGNTVVVKPLKDKDEEMYKLLRSYSSYQP